jgi:hypothetical protein
MHIADFIEDKLNFYAEAIIRGNQKLDEHALGELSFYMALRRIVEKRGNAQDFGMMDAINDTLQKVGILPETETFLSR